MLGLIAEHMERTLSQTIIVENKPGANGNISAQWVVDQPADGRIVWVGTQAMTEINPSVYRNLKWNIDDFVSLIKGVELAPVLVNTSERAGEDARRAGGVGEKEFR